MTNRPLADGFSPVIDAHSHIGHVQPTEWNVRPAEDGLRMMDLCGIERACTFLSYALQFDFLHGNRQTLDIVRRWPDRLIGFCTADPRRGGESVAELDKYLGGEGFRGIKLHISRTDLPYDHPAYDVIYEKAEQYSVPVLPHTFNVPEVRMVLAAAQKFPKVVFIVGHSGGYEWKNCVEEIAAVPNALFDVCCSCADAGRVEAMVAAAGAERVVFGTDNPFLHPAHDLSQVVHARLGRREKALVLGGNMARVLGERE